MSAPVNLRAERLNRGLTAAKAAAAIGVGKQLLLDAENGATPRPENAKMIADFYGHRVTDIWPVDAPEEVAA